MDTKASLATLIPLLKKPLHEKKQCLIGFDGFTDEILHAVDQRSSVKEFQRIETIEQFGLRILAAGGKSTNIELVPVRKKLGGNAPILTNALLEGGHAITFVGAIGSDAAIEPLFQPMARRCKRVVPLCRSGHSDAVEFLDGKIIFGKHQTLVDIDYPHLLQAIPKPELLALFATVDLFASVNWTMLLSMNDLWRSLLQDILPFVSFSSSERWMFVDLADPAKRSDADLHTALQLLLEFKKYYRVVLALNETEALRIGSIHALETPHGMPLDKLAQMIQKQCALDQVVVHVKRGAAVATATEASFASSPYCSKPLLTTGAGDNFNAGYCNGLLHGFDSKQSLLLGISTSGYYIRHGKSPSIEELTQFLQDWNNGLLDS